MTDRARRGLVFAVGVLAILGGAATTAADQLDQSFSGPGVDASVDVNAVFDRAQTFTVGVGGTLTRLRLPLAKFAGTSPTDELRIDVRPTDELGEPFEDDGSALASATILASELTQSLDANAPFEIDLTSQAVTVSPGEVLAIVASSAVPFGALPPRSFAWAARLVTGEGYPGGLAWVRPSTWALQNDGVVDLVFETYVEAPEPAEATATALAAIALLARTRRRGAA